MRLIDADKLKDTCATERGFFCYTVNEVRNAETVNAIPIPKNATNGDMLKALFPDMKRWEYEDKICVDFSKGIMEIKMFPKSWWNAPYKTESEDKE